MFFRNLQIFRVANTLAVDGLADKMAEAQFVHCSAMDRMSQGWVPPRGIDGELLVQVGHHLLLALGVEQKILPRPVIRQLAGDRIREIEAAQGFKVGRKQAREIFETIESELLPRALPKRSVIYVWLDPNGGWFCVDASSSGKADMVVEQLKQTLGELPLTMLKTKMAPATAMTHWLSTGEAPAEFSIDCDCELRSAGERGGAVRYVRHSLDGNDVATHISQGKGATRLALTWKDRISFVLTEQMQIKRVAFLDVLKEQAEQDSEGKDQADAFAADFAIMSGELTSLLGDLTAALGGEAE